MPVAQSIGPSFSAALVSGRRMILKSKFTWLATSLGGGYALLRSLFMLALLVPTCLLDVGQWIRFLIVSNFLSVLYIAVLIFCLSCPKSSLEQHWIFPPDMGRPLCSFLPDEPPALCASLSSVTSRFCSCRWCSPKFRAERDNQLSYIHSWS